MYKTSTIPALTLQQVVARAEKRAKANGGKVTVAFSCRMEQVRVRVRMDADGSVWLDQWNFGDSANKVTTKAGSLFAAVVRALDLGLSFVSAV
jgi:hypothetical protein